MILFHLPGGALALVLFLLVPHSGPAQGLAQAPQWVGTVGTTSTTRSTTPPSAPKPKPWSLPACGYEGSLGHEVQDAQTYAAWGIDYLKYDLCGLRDEMKSAPTPEAAHQIMVDAYKKMRDALRSTSRPIVYSQKALTAHVDFTKLGFTGSMLARDLWQHKDLGALPSLYNIQVPAHGVLMLRLTR